MLIQAALNPLTIVRNITTDLGLKSEDTNIVEAINVGKEVLNVVGNVSGASVLLLELLFEQAAQPCKEIAVKNKVAGEERVCMRMWNSARWFAARWAGLGGVCVGHTPSKKSRKNVAKK
jgi:hypothetical protein